MWQCPVSKAHSNTECKRTTLSAEALLFPVRKHHRSTTYRKDLQQGFHVELPDTKGHSKDGRDDDEDKQQREEDGQGDAQEADKQAIKRQQQEHGGGRRSGWRPLSTHKLVLQMVPADSTSPGKAASPSRVTNSISKFTSSNCLNTELWPNRRRVTGAPQKCQVSGTQIRICGEQAGTAPESWLSVWASEQGTAFCSATWLLPRFYFPPAPKHSVGEFVLKICIVRSTEKSSPWCQKNPETPVGKGSRWHFTPKASECRYVEIK